MAFQPSVLDEDLQLLQKTAREFADGVLAPAAARVDREERPAWENWKAIADMGFLGFLVPEEHGGTGLGNLALAVVLEEINRACASTGVAVSVQNSLIAGPLVKYGTDAQKRKYLPRLVGGDLIGAYAISEPEHGSDAAALETRAEKKGAAYILDGRKAWITNGASAGLIIVFATVDRTLGAKGITAFLVDAKTPGISVGKHEKKLGIRGSETVEIVFENVEVPADAVLSSVGSGFRLAMDTLDGGRIGIAAQATGILAACLNDSVQYSKERRQFGKPIADFQPIQWKIAAMGLDLEMARLLVRQAASLRDAGVPHSRQASMAKLHASEAANRAATQAVQIHGGAGYLKDFAVERYYRDAKITEIYEGTSEIQRLVIARSLLGT